MGKTKRYRRQGKDDVIEIKRKRCIGCTGCAITCTKRTRISVIKAVDEGKKTVVPKKLTFKNTGCIYCGQCTLTCPTGAIDGRNDIEKVKEALSLGKYIVGTTAPSVKATLGEEFKMPIGTDVEGLIISSAKRLGFKKIFFTDFAADMTVVEEGTEFIKRLALKEKLPLFTSCCPAWVRWVELYHPEILEYLSTAKSPQQMMGAAIKTYFAEKMNLSPKDIFTVSIKPCTAKKYEADRDNMGREGYKDIDAVLTTREYAKLLKEKGIDITTLTKEKPDILMGDSTGAAVIFGNSSGVMEAVLRSVAYYLKESQDTVNNVKFRKIDGYTRIKESSIVLSGQEIKLAVVSGIEEMDKFINSEKWKEYTFIEVMACPGGCINGGGAPKIEKKSKVDEKLCIACGTCIDNCPVGALEFNAKGYAETTKNMCVGCTLCSNLCRSGAIYMELYDKATGERLKEDYIDIRSRVLIKLDKDDNIRISAENPELQKMYVDYMGDPEGEKAKSLLHTYYEDRSSELI